MLQLRSIRRPAFPELVPYKVKRTRKKICVFDCETDPFEYGGTVKPFTCGFYDGDVYEEFWGDDCIEQFGRYMAARSSEELLVYAHNFGGFDVHMMRSGLDVMKQPLIINGRICKAYCFGQEFRDSYKIIPVPLKDIQKEEFDYNKNKRELREQHKAEILSYQYSDCINLYRPIVAFHEMFGDRITIGNCAINMLQSFHQFERLNEGQDANMRQYFYGGRTQCFEKGVFKGQWKVYDVNSMYPAVMAKYKHPVGNTIVSTKFITEDTAFIEVEGWNNNALPMRGSLGELDFTVKFGTFKVSIHEYNAATSLGLFKPNRIIKCRNFTKWSNFAAYINHFYDLRMQAKDAGDDLLILFYKLLMNNACGKFAQDGRKYKDYIIMDRDVMPEGVMYSLDTPDGWRIIWEHEYGIIWGRKSIRPPTFLNVATGASITGAARAEMLFGISRAKRPIYCDTDSLICEGFEGDKDAKRLGAWKFEAEGSLAAIAGKKMYVLFNEDKMVKKAAKGVGLTAMEILDVASGKEIIYKPIVPTFGLDGSVEYTNRTVRMT